MFILCVRLYPITNNIYIPSSISNNVKAVFTMTSAEHRGGEELRRFFGHVSALGTKSGRNHEHGFSIDACTWFQVHVKLKLNLNWRLQWVKQHILYIVYYVGGLLWSTYLGVYPQVDFLSLSLWSGSTDPPPPVWDRGPRILYGAGNIAHRGVSYATGFKPRLLYC